MKDRKEPKKTPQEIFLIEKNIPIPKGTQYPFKKMQVGDSFAIEKAAGLYTAAKKAGVKIVVRKQSKGYRVWRFQ